jgi:hypothetical protein
VVIAAPSPVAYAEVLQFTNGAWSPLARWEKPGRVLEKTFPLEVTAPTTVYLRCELEAPMNGRPARAWGSPIWLAP